MSQSEDCANSCRFDNGAECFIVVNTGTLCKAAKNPTSLVSVQRAINVKFMFENPLACDHVGLVGARNKVPSVIFHESSIFIFHGATPVRISKGVAARPGNRGQSLGVEMEARLYVSRLPTGHHAMSIVDRWDGDSTNRTWRISFDEPWWRWDDVGAARRSGSWRWCRR